MLLIFIKEISRECDWYNGNPPPDNLNPECCKAFINTTHEKYKGKVEGEFGKTVVGFFTDETNITDFFSSFENGRPWVPWTDDFADNFSRVRGYDLLDYVPLMFLSVKNPGKPGMIIGEQ